MKKFRGKKRYFRHLKEDSLSLFQELDTTSWFDFAHIHLDWYGVGNLRGNYRKEHIRQYLALYEVAYDSFEALHKEVQLWVYLDAHDAGQDALFIHSENPNETEFPYVVENLTWEETNTPLLDAVIDKKRYRVGQLRNDNKQLIGYIVVTNKTSKMIDSF